MKKGVIRLILCILIIITLVLISAWYTHRQENNNAVSAEKSAEKIALVRLEDVGPGEHYKLQENIDKLMVLADYLQQEGIPFSVSLIPRMVEPDRNYDVSIGDDTPYTQQFLAAMKGLEQRGGIIGVHGYTHQSGSSRSVAGYEFYSKAKNPDVPNTFTYAEERADKAIALFNQVGIKPAYWETPHYSASAHQLVAFQKKFGIIYENNYYYPEAWKRYAVLNENDQYYCGLDVVPAPIGHLNSPDRLSAMLAVLDDPEKSGTLASFYVHPTYEFQFIKKVELENGKTQYVYDENSLLHQCVREFKSRGYQFVSLYSLVGFVPAQREEKILFNPGDELYAGQFVKGTPGNSLLVWNKKADQWHMYQYTAPWFVPRDLKAFADRGVWLKDLALPKGTIPLTGYFINNARQDLMLFNPVSRKVILAENDGDKFIPQDMPMTAFNNLKKAQPLAGDLNGDGLTDLFLYDRDNSRIGTAINTGGTFTDFSWQPFSLLKKENLQLTVGDYNGDGRCDIVILDPDKNLGYLLSGNTSNNFTLGDRINNQIQIKEDERITTADVNGDGKDDLLIINPNGLWQYAISNGSEFDSVRSYGPWGQGKDEAALAADINGDNKADLVMIDHAAGRYNMNTAISVLDTNL
ncbi:DUF2334 domain-containing protein [Dehalobacter sp. DCM]|uniref:DUF2334 domain-containing protein n=1 Tax=Dehalobacter sp. DCM TaxID=2907827 RepID=UPI00308195CB|nr:DUF2334 domain-containing protein [Dehalobacter sp. DCM]